MKIAVLTRFKHGLLFEALQNLGWNQSQLAEASGISNPQIADIVNLRRPPSEKEATAIETALGMEGIPFDILEAWPNGFRGLGHKASLTFVSNADFDPAIAIEATSSHILPPHQSFIRDHEGTEDHQLLSEIVNSAHLSPLEKTAVDIRFGTRTGVKRTYMQTAVEIGEDHKCVENSLTRALFKLRRAAAEVNPESPPQDAVPGKHRGHFSGKWKTLEPNKNRRSRTKKKRNRSSKET